MKEIVLEKIINQLANNDVIDLSSLNNKTIVISLTDINLDICFYINNNQIFIFDEVKTNNVHISITSSAFLALLDKNNLTDLIREEKLVLVGEVKTAQLLIDVLNNNKIKDKVKQFLPEPVNNKISEIKQDCLNNKDKIKDDIINFFIQPKVYK